MSNWISVCSESDLVPNVGICALVEGEQIAIFYSERLKELFAISNYDPFSEMNVLSRGLIGSIGDAIVVASPLYKQHFDLRTGVCVEDPETAIKVYPVRLEGSKVEIQMAASVAA